jgi:hypothetical protein
MTPFMKTLIVLYALLVAPTCNADPELWFNQELAVQLEEELIDMVKRIDKQGLIPSDVAENLKDKTKMWSEFPVKSQAWLLEDLPSVLTNPKITELYSKLDWEHHFGNEVVRLDLFLAIMRGQEFDILQKLRSIKLSQLELRRPKQDLTPIGSNKIVWIWRLNVEGREHGILHVGIDVKTRNFICYEYPVGIYYPEGDVLQRIHTTIVQDDREYRLIESNLKLQSMMNSDLND